MNKAIDFLSPCSFAVTAYSDDFGELGNGTLSFGAGDLISLGFNLSADLERRVDTQKCRTIKAKTEDGDSFTLFACQFSGPIVYADQIVAGDVSDSFTAVDVRYSDVSEWFLRFQHIDGKLGDQLVWKNLSEPMSAAIKLPEQEFVVESRYEASMEGEGENHVLHEHVTFCLRSLARGFNIVDVRAKALTLSSLFSILLAHPASLISVSVSSDGKRFYAAYFATFKPIAREGSDRWFLHRCFIQKKAIETRWQTILEEYFTSKHREVSWTRLASMQRYDDFWEYKVLGYVSLVDQYVKQCSHGRKPPPHVPKKRMANFVKGVEKLSPRLGENVRKDIIALVERVFAIESQNFTASFKMVLDESDRDVIRIINLLDEDFSYIKRIRDEAAHGDAATVETDFTRVGAIIAKITLLMTYWAFVDMGLTAEDFTRALVTTGSRLRMTAQLDSVHLARVTKTADFFLVARSTFDALSKNQRIVVSACFVQSPDGTVELSEQLTQSFQAWRSDRNRESNVFNPSECFSVPADKVKAVPSGYLECGSETLQVIDSFVCY